MTDITNYSDINLLIKEYMPLIVRGVSNTTGRYVSVENDDELSIGLMAFKEAVERYDSTRGSFPSYAQLVISSRVKSYLVQQNKFKSHISLNELSENGIEVGTIVTSINEDREELAEEIRYLQKEINRFGFSFEDLVTESPKHIDTRERAIEISENINKEKNLKDTMYIKKRLPIKEISLRFSVTEKILKKSKKFIISVVIILDKNYNYLKGWIRR